MKPWIKRISYFLIFSFLITGIRGCVNDTNLGDVTYGFPFVYMDSKIIPYGVSGIHFWEDIENFKLHPSEIKNFYKENLIYDLVFWIVIFGIFFHLRNKPIFVKFRSEINYGLFFAAIFTISLFFANVFDFLIIGFLGIPGFWILFYSGSLFQSLIIDNNPPFKHFVYEELKKFYPFYDDFPSRVGFVFAFLSYFILGVLIYRIRVRYLKHKKSSPK